MKASSAFTKVTGRIS
ncbi:hypothetical protein E2C01_095070 [Portunus trituberculatus]|uniref:Uncharacterized protein n=1 Tax=Portunus trituberculatus TaxID=210409 RepID=A0A5B7JZ14_PORTR|nr:hypothetical protein [Portunus trituberculatus]